MITERNIDGIISVLLALLAITVLAIISAWTNINFFFMAVLALIFKFAFADLKREK